MTATSESVKGALLRQSGIVLATIAVIGVGAWGTALQILPKDFQATAKLKVAKTEQASGAALALQSEDLSRTVIEELQMAGDPELSIPDAPDGKFLSLSLGPTSEVTQAVIEHFRQRVAVTVNGTDVLLSYRSGNSDQAVRVVNELAETYVDSTAAPAPSQGGEDLGARIRELQSDISLTEQKITALKTQPSNDDLQTQQAALLAEQTELAKRYGPKHPKMIALQGKLQDLNLMLRQPSYAKDIEELQQGLYMKRRELDELLTTLSSRAQQRVVDPAAPKIVSLAMPPLQAQRQVPGLLYGAVLLSGLLIGLFLAWIYECLNRGFKSPQHIEGVTGLPTGEPIPFTEDMHAGSILQKPTSPTAESVRTLRATLRLLSEKEGRPLKVLAVTSSHDSEKRALLSIYLARLASRGGEKVLLVDGDLRNPQIHALLHKSNTPSLVDYLTGQNHLEQIVWKQDPSGMHVILASAMPNTALDLIGSEKMKKLMGYLRQGYDLVIVCTPPCLPSADASLLANESDYLLYVIEAHETAREDVAKGLKIFSGFGFSSIAPVLTRTKKG